MRGHTFIVEHAPAAPRSWWSIYIVVVPLFTPIAFDSLLKLDIPCKTPSSSSLNPVFVPVAILVAHMKLNTKFSRREKDVVCVVPCKPFFTIRAD